MKMNENLLDFSIYLKLLVLNVVKPFQIWFMYIDLRPHIAKIISDAISIPIRTTNFFIKWKQCSIWSDQPQYENSVTKIRRSETLQKANILTNLIQ